MLKNLAIAIVAGTLLGSVGAATLRALSDPASLRYVFANTIWLFGFGLLFAIPASIIYGAPLYLLLQRFRAVGWVSTIAFGALPGLILLIYGEVVLAPAVLMVGTCIACTFHMLMGRHAANKRLQPTRDFFRNN